MSHAIYNEIDPFAAQWLRNLITADQIAPGVVDDRSIKDLAPADVAGPGQRHFFAGIAGWSLALRYAGVPDDADVWTGSCPCQGLSDAGKRLGFDDPRHLWPDWFRLIRECRPSVVFGEQVASSLGLAWLDLVHADLEGEGYTFGAADLCAAGVGAPHRRQRLFFVAYADSQPGRLLAAQRQPRRADAQAERRGEAIELADPVGQRRDGVPRDARTRRERPESAGSGETSIMADSSGRRRGKRRDSRGGDRSGSIDNRASVLLGNTQGAGRRARRSSEASGETRKPRRSGQAVELGNASGTRSRRNARAVPREEASSERERIIARSEPDVALYAGTDHWQPCDWIPCSDGVSRPVEPGTHPLAHGVPGRVGLLRGYGNAFPPEVAATFIRAALEAA